MKYFVAVALFWWGLQPVFAQKVGNPLAGQLIVQLKKGVEPSVLQASWSRSFPNFEESSHLVFKKISEPMNAWLATFSETNFSKEALLEVAQKTAGVEAVQFNAEVEYRTTTPNDPQFFKQTDMDLIRASDAWDASTGDTTAQGDEIVVAILEKGMYRSHPDLKPNLWKNTSEIPNNGLDDDQNGFVDDYAGWDVRNENDGEGTITPHGVAVAGIVGARGDNSEGVTGVLWRVKLMSLVNCSYVSEIVAAYSYVLVQRRLYNQTSGKKGAFVVATNASFGIDGATPEQFPTWAAIYDSLGVVGVLSVGATGNVNANVDLVGDMPSTAPSEWLITVTNVNAQTDVKVNSAAFGKVNVDLGSPGDGTYTTDFRVGSNDTTFYSNLTNGTSAATPHVTGAVAFLYSLNCKTLCSDRLSDPQAAARRIRDLILDSAEPNASLKNITKTGGRLDLFNALNRVRDLCGGTIGNLSITKITPSLATNEIEVDYQTPDFLQYTILVSDALGQVLFQKDVTPDQFSEKKVKFDTTYLAAGTYFVSIQTKFHPQKALSKKFIKVK